MPASLRLAVRPSVRNELRQVWCHLAGKANSTVSRIGHLLVAGDGSDHPDKRAVRTVVANGIGQHVGLGLVLVSDTASVRLVPVDNELLLFAIVDDVFADVIALTLYIVDGGVSG